MPSPGSRTLAAPAAARDQVRTRGELVLRMVALGALIYAFLLMLDVFGNSAKSAAAPLVFRVDATQKGSPSLVSLARQSLINGVANNTSRRALHFLASRVPSDTDRALLSAAKIAGVPVTWTDSTTNGAIAIEARAQIDPRGGYTLRVAAPNGTPIAFRDSLGLIDSVTATGGGASVAVGRLAGTVSAASVSARANALRPVTQIIRKILLFAEPGWEAKFTTAALEERGWTVEARYAIGKNVAVTQGAPVAPDTSRYAVVIALDSSAASHASAIRRFALSGGGVVVAGVATTLREFGNMLPGRAGERQAGIPGALDTDTPLMGLAWRPITPDSDAAVVARSSRKTNAALASVVAHRFGAGRVVESAYDGMWEWRMAGPDGSLDAHRQWWSAIVSSVAFAPEQTHDAAGHLIGEFRDEPGSVAPYADSRARLGASSPMPTTEARMDSGIQWELILMLVAVLALVAEWSSRRLRGAK